ncbi:hypothetical protein J6X04_00790 [Candidatus Saccharibacteria bacterium]|nr:hypothetical protein [Candidatus Saccharibacteria bacterium]
MSGEAVRTGQEQPQNNGWDSLTNEFAGERNINDKTGKDRTFSQMDLYPRMKGETPEEYGARLRYMNQETAKYLEEEARKEQEELERQRQLEYERSEQGQQEAAAESNYDRLEAKLEQAVSEGRMTREHANRLLEKQMDKAIDAIDAARQDYSDRQTIGPEEDQIKYNEWLSKHDAENLNNLEITGRQDAEAEERARLEAEERARLEAEENTQSQPETTSGDKEFAKFQVASGVSKEAEFKRLTGEDWPGEKYYAVTAGADEGYDEPIENWTIYERPASEITQQPEAISEDEVFGHFQVASGVSKEAEFKRLTGEDWPGVEYYATCYGVDEGYDEPIENWTIYKRSNANQAPNTDPDGGDKPDGEKDPSDGDKPNDGEKQPGSNTADGEKDPDDKTPEGNKNKVDLGEGDLKNLEVTIDEDKTERLKEIEDKLEAMLPELAELYARNRRIFVGAKNRADFIRVKGEYAKLLDESLKLKAEGVHRAGQVEISEKIQNRVDELNQEIQAKLLEFVGGDPENTEKTQEEVDAEKARLTEEAEKTLRAEYGDMVKELEANVSANFLSNYLDEAVKLEDATIDALDNGTICRKFVNKVINNKYLKGALIAAGVAGLAATGVGLGMGLAAGTMSVSLGYTAGGVALGAGKGAMMGGLMSRQDSRNSTVRGFVSEEDIKKQLEGINNQDADTSNVTSWLLEQYSGANTEDASSNRRKTAVAAGIGAALGGLVSGVHIDNVSTREVTERVQIGTEPTKYEPDLFDNVNIPKGHGMSTTFDQMGGDPSNLQKALDIAHKIDPKYGMVPGSNGETVGVGGQIGEFAHTYPGPISEWPDVAQSYMTEVAEEWARQGLIPSHMTGGEPIYDTVTRVVTEYVPNAFMNFLTRATATVGAGAIGGRIGGVGERPRITRSETEASEPITNPEPIPEPTPGPAPEPILGGAPTAGSTPETPPSTPEATPTNVTQEDIDSKLAELEEAMKAAEASTSETGAGSTPEATPTNVTQEDIDSKLAELEEAMKAAGVEIGDETPERIPTLADSIAEDFRDRAGEEGVAIMTSEEYINEENSARIARWWNTLDEDTKREISQFEMALGTSGYGRALREWIRLNNQNSL